MQATQLGTDIQTHTPLYLPEQERTYHTVIIGQTRFGKTNLLQRMVIEDLKNDINAVVFDPHGDLSEELLLQASSAQKADKVLLYEIAADSSYIFNPVEVKNPNDPMEVSRTVDSLMQVFRKHWTSYAWGPRVEWVLSNCIRTLVSNPGHTLDEIPLLLRDDQFRSRFLPNITNPQVHEFWRWYRTLESTRRPQDEWQLIESTLTRLSQFLANEWLVRILYQPVSTVNFDKIINNYVGHLTIFSLPIGRLGEEPAALLGSLLLGRLATTIFSRIDHGTQLPRLHIYIDELSRFSLPITARLWTEGGKYNIGLTATLQTLSQLQDDENKSAVLQAGNHICFQCIGADAQVLSQQMPLPDPASLMKPEPMLLYSRTAIQDIWEKGHPNKSIMTIRGYYFKFFRELDTDKQKEWFEYPFFDCPFDKEDDWYYDPNYGKDWYMRWYRTPRVLLEEAREKLNEHFYRSMNHSFDAQTSQVVLLFEAMSRMLGILGIRAAYSHGKNPEIQAYIDEKLARNPRAVISPHEQEQLETWNPIQYPDEWTQLFIEAFTGTIKTLPLSREPFPDAALRYQEWDTEYHYNSYDGVHTALHWITGNTLQEAKKRGEVVAWRLERAQKIAQWEVRNFCNTITYLTLCGTFLEKEPLHIPSHSYRDVEYSRRTFADVRDELAQRLVSLPRYEAIAALVGETTIKHIKTLTLPSLMSTAQAGAQQIRTRSRQQVNKPMQEIIDTLKKRNQSKSQGNLPPPKTHI